MPWGAIAAAGAQVVGALFGGKKKNTVTTSRVDYKRLVRDAEAAGFNPLTALRNGGAAGFSVTSTSGGHAPLSSRIADGVAGAMNVLGQSEDFLSNFDPHRDNVKEASYRHLLAQTENLEASTAAMLSQAANYERRPSGGAAQLSKQGAALAELGMPQQPEAGDVTVTNPHAQALVDPNVRDGATWAERYGEPGEYPGAYYSTRADLQLNLRQKPGLVWRSVNQLMRDGSLGGLPAYLLETYGPALLGRRRNAGKGGGGW